MNSWASCGCGGDDGAGAPPKQASVSGLFAGARAGNGDAPVQNFLLFPSSLRVYTILSPRNLLVSFRPPPSQT